MKSILKRKALRDTSYVYVGLMLNSLGLFVINVLLSRTLPKEQFSIFVLSVLVLTVVAEMSDFGMNAGLLRFAPLYIIKKQTEKLKQLVKTIFRWRVWLAVILTVGGIALSDIIAQYVFNQPQLGSYFRLSFIGIGGVILLGFITTYLKASQRFARASMFSASKGLVRLALIALLFLVGSGQVSTIILAYIVVPWALAVLAFKYLPKAFWKAELPAEDKTKMHRQLFKFSFWLTVWSFAAIITTQVDQIMISNFLGLEEVALYSVAFQFIFLYNVGIQSVSSVMLPKLNALTDKAAVKTFFRKMYGWIIPLIIGLAVVIYPSQYLFKLIFGSAYFASVPIYLVLSYSMLIAIFQIPFSFIPQLYNRTDIIALSAFLMLAVNVALNFYFIPAYGPIGAAFTFLAGLVFSASYNMVWSWYLLAKKEIQVS